MKFNDIKSRPPADVDAVYDGNQLRLTLSPLGGGGESKTYTCPERPGAVVKIYRPDLIADGARLERIVARLNALVGTRVARLPSLALPREAVYDEAGHRLVGYVMPRVPDGFVRFSSLFGGVKSVRRAFPDWTRRDLAEVALNFIALVETLMRAGVMPADWNPDNYYVDARHRIMCIDCDSYQVQPFGGHTCHVSDAYFEPMAAPELLLDGGLKGRPRTEEQTRFSVALMVFRLLMCGMHPFQFADAALDGTLAGSVVENLKAGKCPLGRGACCRFAPVWAPLWSWLTGKLKDMFITTFRREPGHGWGEPACRAPLDVQMNEVKRFIFEMGRMPERAMLEPPNVKSSEYIKVRPTFTAYSVPGRLWNPPTNSFRHAR